MLESLGHVCATKAYLCWPHFPDFVYFNWLDPYFLRVVLKPPSVIMVLSISLFVLTTILLYLGCVYARVRVWVCVFCWWWLTLLPEFACLFCEPPPYALFPCLILSLSLSFLFSCISEDSYILDLIGLLNLGTLSSSRSVGSSKKQMQRLDMHSISHWGMAGRE